MDPITVLAALGPVVVDLGKSLINRFIAGDTFKPANIDEYVKMRQMDLDQFTAINAAGGTNESYPWVEAIVRLMRPTVAIVVLGTWAYLKIINESTPSVDNFASCIGFYLFGDRTLFYSNKK